MFKIAIDEIAERIEELKETDKRLVRERIAITEAEREFRNSGTDELYKVLKQVTEELLDRRKEVFELIVSLDRIRKVYEKQEEKVLEMLETSYCRSVRDGAWVAIEFPEQEMELIGYIKV